MQKRGALSLLHHEFNCVDARIGKQSANAQPLPNDIVSTSTDVRPGLHCTALPQSLPASCLWLSAISLPISHSRCSQNCEGLDFITTVELTCPNQSHAPGTQIAHAQTSRKGVFGVITEVHRMKNAHPQAIGGGDPASRRARSLLLYCLCKIQVLMLLHCHSHRLALVSVVVRPTALAASDLFLHSHELSRDAMRQRSLGSSDKGRDIMRLRWAMHRRCGYFVLCRSAWRKLRLDN
ncbi:hypothetical protein EJ03DRAFT_123675 [Teratosphaeria nubilosa]|uniref:Uncharacterized protein n=1 Tax=Teratosphaeria nubilosa TaxID=161662 RepID=A0A6G1LK00_9PEZI|nr:hypothetical protein EJ03DRAFT_123675 [Teratosphaeria nubilosa]